jgi:hypothetical protein
MEGTTKAVNKAKSGNLGGAASDYATGDVWREDWRSNKDKFEGITDEAKNALGGGSGPNPSNPLQVQGPGAVNPAGFAGGRLSTGDIALAGPTGAHINTLAQGQFRGYQDNLAKQLAERASGQGQFVSDLALKQAQDTNQAATFAQLASARGGANPLLARQTMATSSDLAAKTSRDAALAKLAEMQQSQATLGQVAGQGREQDIGLAQAQASLHQQANLAGYQGGIQQMQSQAQLNQQMAMQYNDLVAKYAAMGIDAQRANQMAAIEVDRIRYQGDQAAKDRGANMLGGLMSTGGTILGAYFGGPAGAAVGNQAGAKLASNTGNGAAQPDGYSSVAGSGEGNVAASGSNNGMK